MRSECRTAWYRSAKCRRDPRTFMEEKRRSRLSMRCLIKCTILLIDRGEEYCYQLTESAAISAAIFAGA
jgi:hypothetical protein